MDGRIHKRSNTDHDRSYLNIRNFNHLVAYESEEEEIALREGDR